MFPTCLVALHWGREARETIRPPEPETDQAETDQGARKERPEVPALRRELDRAPLAVLHHLLLLDLAGEAAEDLQTEAAQAEPTRRLLVQVPRHPLQRPADLVPVPVPDLDLAAGKESRMVVAQAAVQGEAMVAVPVEAQEEAQEEALEAAPAATRTP
jgi:hypothetical protein